MVAILMAPASAARAFRAKVGMAQWASAEVAQRADKAHLPGGDEDVARLPQRVSNPGLHRLGSTLSGPDRVLYRRLRWDSSVSATSWRALSR